MVATDSVAVVFAGNVACGVGSVTVPLNPELVGSGTGAPPPERFCVCVGGLPSLAGAGAPGAEPLPPPQPLTVTAVTTNPASARARMRPNTSSINFPPPTPGKCRYYRIRVNPLQGRTA